MPGKVVTFYSYGGAGRTMALANVAVRLAKLGLRVVAVDWDLEGPGLHRFLPVKDVDAPHAKGLLEFFSDWREAVMANDPEPPSILKDVRETTVPCAPGSLRVIPAGRLDRTFPARAEALDIRTFYSCDAGGAAVETLRDELTENADLVLVDSRSGLNDIAGVCGIQLPDGVVFLSLPNERCYEGATSVARGIKYAPPPERVDRAAPTTWFVLSRAPRDRHLLASWLEAHEKLFDGDVKAGLWTGRHPNGLRSYYLPDMPRWAFGEQIVPSESGEPGDAMHPETMDHLAFGYDKLAGELFAWTSKKTEKPGIT